MRVISFAWTKAALLAGEKTVTRRDWKDSWAHGFRKGDLVAAYDRDRRYGGRQVGVVRLTRAPYRAYTDAAPAEDWEREGFAYLEARGIEVDGMRPSRLWRAWHTASLARVLWVVRFELVEALEDAEAWLAERGPKEYRERGALGAGRLL